MNSKRTINQNSNFGNWRIFLLIPGILFFFFPFEHLCSQTVILTPQEFSSWEKVSIYIMPEALFLSPEEIRLNNNLVNNGIHIPRKRESRSLFLRKKSDKSEKTIFYSISLSQYSEKDTIFIEYNSFVKEAKINSKKNRLGIKNVAEIGKIFTKRYSRFLRKRINSRKLALHIATGEYFNTPYDEIRAIKAFENFKDSQLDSLWHFQFFNRSYSDRTLFIEYFEKLNNQEISYHINCDRSISEILRFQSYMYFISLSANEWKDRLYSLFESATNSSFLCDAEELIALYFAYHYLMRYGISEETDHPYSLNSDILSQLLNSITNDRYKNDFLEFLESIKIKPLREDTELVTAQNNAVQLSEYFDKPYVILDFWATWCQPCIRAFPDLKVFNDKWGSKMNLLSISVDHDFNRFQNWTTSRPEYDWAFLYTGLDHHLVRDLNVRAFPTYLIYDTTSDEIFGPYHTVEEIEGFFYSVYENYID